MFFHSIEGNPFIIRFKTFIDLKLTSHLVLSIEGNPFIIRFKTKTSSNEPLKGIVSIEGNPFIIRFKTSEGKHFMIDTSVLKVIHL